MRWLRRETLSRNASREDAPHPRTMLGWPVSNIGPPAGHGPLRWIASIPFRAPPGIQRETKASAFSTFNRGTAALVASRETLGKRPSADATVRAGATLSLADVQGADLP